MGIAWTAEQVLALSPDAGSTKRGRSLASLAKWPLLGKSARALWGECQGSGKKPYRTIIDLDVDLGGPAFRCSCPSRKFPCKHAIALFLLATTDETFTEGNPPSWGADWLDKRAQTATQKPATQQAANPEVQAQQAQKRLEKRTAKVTAGLEDLEQWLQDIIRRGLADLPSQPYSFWDQAAARLIDAQAPGLARRVQELASIPHAPSASTRQQGGNSGGWPDKMLKALGQLNLLVQSYRNLEQLSPAMQAEVRSQIGFTQTKEDLYQRAEQSEDLVTSLNDTWQILGKVVTEENALKTQRVWLWAMQARKAAMVLSFAHGRRQPLDASLVPGACFNGRLIFYPGTGQQGTSFRALVAEKTAAPDVCRDSIGDELIETAIAHYTDALSQNPWLYRAPMTLNAVLLRYLDSRWWLQDNEDKMLPLSPAFAKGWELLAMSGGRPLAVFGEWDGESLLPLSVWSDKKFMTLEA